MSLLAALNLLLALLMLSACLYLLSPRQTLWPAARSWRMALWAGAAASCGWLLAATVPLYGVWPALFLALTLLMTALPLWPLLCTASRQRRPRDSFEGN